MALVLTDTDSLIVDRDDYVPDGLDPDARLDALYPAPEISDIFTFRNRVNRHRQTWLREVARVRELRFHQDTTPDKWQQRLNIPQERRFRTNLTANEVERVTAMLSRNKPRVYIPPMGETNQAVDRSQLQSRWSQQLLVALETNSPLPLFWRGDDAAVEVGIGCYEWYLTEQWEAYREASERRDAAASAQERKEVEAELRALGLPFALRMIDPMSVLWEPDDHGTGTAGKVLIVERKAYAQVFYNLQDSLDPDEFAAAQLPNVIAQGYPPETFRIMYRDQGVLQTYDGVPDTDGEVEVMRYYDRRWCVEIVAGRIVARYPHGLPGVPVFIQFGKVTSNPYMGFQLRGVTFGMMEAELGLNDLLTLWLDNQFTYGRPFPVVETAIDGNPIIDPKTGMPQVINLVDPRQPPTLGPGQKMADAFAGFKGQIDPQFLQMLNRYFQVSGLNPIAQGESPGADSSGYALNTLSSAATSLYAGILENKERVLQNVIDFSRAAVRSTIQGTVYLSVESEHEQGTSIEYIGLSPEDVDEIPSRVQIDPLSDSQRLAVTEWLRAGNQEGYIQRRTVQRYAYGSVVEDIDAEDDAIIRDQARQQLLPTIIQSVVQQVAADAFPETQQPAGPGGPMPPSPPGGPGPEPTAPTIGGPAAAASQVSPAGPSPVAALAARGRGGQQPTRNGVPRVGQGA